MIGSGIGHPLAVVVRYAESMAGASYPTCKATGKCAASGRDFLEGEKFVATLTEQPVLGTNVTEVARTDFSVEAWASGARPASPAVVLGSWRAVYHAGEQKKSPLMGDQEMLDLFEEMAQVTEQRQVRFRYLLALLLIRKRLLRVISTKRTPEGTVMTVLRRGEDAGQATPGEVIDPGLDEATIAEAIEQLGLIVEGT